MVSTSPSGSCGNTFARNTQHTCASSNHPWRNTLFLGGVNHFWKRRGLTKSGFHFLWCCFAVWFVLKPVWLAAIGSYGRRGPVWWAPADFLAKPFTAAGTECGLCFSLRLCKFDVMEVWREGVRGAAAFSVKPVLGDYNKSFFIFRE